MTRDAQCTSESEAALSGQRKLGEECKHEQGASEERRSNRSFTMRLQARPWYIATWGRSPRAPLRRTPPNRTPLNRAPPAGGGTRKRSSAGCERIGVCATRPATRMNVQPALGAGSCCDRSGNGYGLQTNPTVWRACHRFCSVDLNTTSN